MAGDRALACVAALLLAACGGSGGGDGSVAPGASATGQVVDAYTLVASKALAVDASGAVFDGAGGGLFTLQHLPGDPQAPLRMVAPEKLVTSGFVRDLALSDQHVYAAAWRAGLAVFRRSDWAVTHALPLSGTEGASTVAVIEGEPAQCPGKRIVIVGTDDPDGGAPAPGPSGGRLLVLEHDLASDSLALRAVLDVGATVQCVAASAAIAGPPSGTNTASFSVLLGADCARVDGQRASLQRRDFSYHCANGALVVTQDSVTPWPAATNAPECIVRDVVIDEARARAYAAAYFHGVFAFDLSAGALVADTSAGWPLVVQGAQQSQREGYANALALDPAPELAAGKGARLCVGWGQPFAGEWQYFGDSSRRECAQAPSADTSQPVRGVFVYRLDASDDPELGPGGAITELELQPPEPRELDGASALQVVRYGAGPDYHLFVAADTDGLALVRVSALASGSSASFEAYWDEFDPGHVALQAHDDALVIDGGGGRFLCVATEEGVATFDLAVTLADARCSGGSQGSVPAPCSELGQGVTLAAFPAPNPRVLAATSNGFTTVPGGLRVYDVGGGSALALQPELDKGGRGFAVAAVPGAWSGTKPADADRARWVLTTQSDAADPSASFTVQLWDLGSANDPHDPGCGPPCTPAELVATWQDAPADDLLEGLATQEVDGGRELAVYVPYGVNGESQTSLGSARAGVVVLRITLDSNGDPHFIKVQKTSDFLDVDPTFKAGRASFDAASRRLFVAWGTGGLAVYDATAPYKLVRLAKRDLSAELGAYNKRLSPSQILLGPTACGREFVYVAFLEDGVGVLGSDLAGAIAFLPVAGQAISITLDPSDPTRRTLFVSEGRAGVEKLAVDPCP